MMVRLMAMGTTGYGLTPGNPWEFQEKYDLNIIFEPEGNGDFFGHRVFRRKFSSFFLVDW